MDPLGLHTVSQLPIIREVGERFIVIMSSPTQATMNTSDTFTRPCVNERSCPNRSCAYDAPPVLRTGVRPERFSKQLCSEKGGDTGIQRNSTTSDAVTPMDQSSAPEGVESVDPIEGAGPPSSPSVLDESNDPQDLHQGSFSEGGERHSERPENTPVALRTRSKGQL